MAGNTSRRFLISLFLIGLQVVVPQLAYADTKLLPNFRMERNSEAALVSGGGWLAGLGYLGKRVRDRPLLRADVPKGWRGESVCLRSTRRSGRYFNRFQYPLEPNFNGGRVTLVYDGSHADQMKEMGPVDDGFVLAKGTCAQPTSEVVPILPNVHPAPSNSSSERVVFVNINARRANQMALLATHQGAKLDVRCKKLRNDTEGRIAFNHSCAFGVPAKMSGQVELEFWAWFAGNVRPPKRATIHLVSDE